jgi:glycogen(starch) synthase
MRILCWSELFWPYIGGAEVFAARMLSAWSARGYEPVVVTAHDWLSLPDDDTYNGTPIFRFPFRTAIKARDIESIHALRHRVADLVRRLRPDLYFLNGVGPSALFLEAARAAHRAPLLAQLNQEVLGSQFERTGSVLGRVLSGADWVVSVSREALDHAHTVVPEIARRCSMIPYGIALPELAPTPLPFAPPVVLCLGRLVPYKGFDVAVQALARLRGRVPALRVLIAGDGECRADLEQQVADGGLAAVTTFLGWVEPEDVPTVLNRATVVVMPSRREGLPLVGLQASAMARPIVATRAGGLPEIVVDGATGLLIDKDDVGGLAEAVASLLEHPADATRMGTAGRERCRTHFSWERCVDAYDTLCTRLTEFGDGAPMRTPSAYTAARGYSWRTPPR